VSDFVDTNIVIRYLTRDDEDKFQRARILFERARAGDVDLFTTEAVVLEIVQVLSSPRGYRMERDRIALRVSSLLANSWLGIDHKTTILRALDLYGETKLDFTDCLAVEHSRRVGGAIYSFDRGLDRVARNRRLEP